MRAQEQNDLILLISALQTPYRLCILSFENNSWIKEVKKKKNFHGLENE